MFDFTGADGRRGIKHRILATSRIGDINIKGGAGRIENIYVWGRGGRGVEGRSVMRGENGAATSLSYALFAEGWLSWPLVLAVALERQLFNIPIDLWDSPEAASSTVKYIYNIYNTHTYIS